MWTDSLKMTFGPLWKTEVGKLHRQTELLERRLTDSESRDRSHHLEADSMFDCATGPLQQEL